MKVRRILLLFLMLLITLAACSPGHSGSNEIAFLRNGQFWTIDPDGANALAIVSSGSPVVGYNWSPTHQFLAFRTLDDTFASTPAAKQLNSNPINGQVGDIQSTINSLGVDGGTPIPTAFSSPDIRYSNAIWDASGTRLIYRQTGKANPANPSEASWIVAQNDQPGGIAAKLLPPAYTIPSFSYNKQLLVAISSSGIFTTTLAGTQQHFLVRNPLPGHPLPASIGTRPMATSPPGYTYPLCASRLRGQQRHMQIHCKYNSRSARWMVTQLRLQPVPALNLHGHRTAIPSCIVPEQAIHCSILPRTLHLLFRSMQTAFLTGRLIASFCCSMVYIPWFWCSLPGNNRSVLLQDNRTSSTAGFPFVPTASTLLQPVENNIWASDSRHFLFLTHNRLQWQGKALYFRSGALYRGD